MRHDVHQGSRGGEVGQDLRGAVATAIVDQDDLKIRDVRAQCLQYISQRCGDRLFFIVDGQNDRKTVRRAPGILALLELCYIYHNRILSKKVAYKMPAKKRCSTLKRGKICLSMRRP